MKRLALLFLLLPFFAQAQTNTARMLSGVNAQTGLSYTFVCTDATMLVVFNNPAPVSATLFAATDPCSGPGIMFSIKNIGGAVVTITPVSGRIDGNPTLQLQPLQGADLWNDGANYFSQGGGVGGGGAPPRLDQVLDPNVDKAFNLGITNLSFFNGNVSFIGTSFAIPNSAGCTATATGQICLDTTLLNVHLWNGADANIGLFPAASTFTDGDVLGVSVVAGKQTLQDLAPVNASSGNTFWLVNNTTPLDGDIPCWDTTGPPFANNCTPGAIDTSIAGATNTYTISIADQLSTIDHDAAGSQSVAITLPTAITLGLNPGFVFIYSNHSTHADTITPTTWTINGAGTLTVASNNFCRVRVDPASATSWIADCAASAAVTGNLTGTLTSGKVPVASGPTTLIDGSILDDNTHAARDNNGFDVNSLGALDYWILNNTVTGTTVNKMVCDDGTGKGIICPFATSTTNDPLGSAIATNGATPGTSGSTGICNIGFCTVVMDNGATANHYAQQSTTVAGDLSDVGTTPPTNGQPYWHIVVGNAGAGTTAVFRNMDSSELNASSGGNGKSTTVQINGVSTKNIATFNTGGGITWSKADSGNTSTVTATVNAQYKTLRCETGLGDGLNAMAAGTYLQFFCVNTSGVTWTITGINCWTDNAGTSTLNAANNAGTGLLTGAVTCNATKSGGGAAGTQSGTTTLANNDAISFTFVADGTSKQTTWTVSMTQ